MIRCAGCGKWISYDAVSKGKVRCEYEPDSHFGRERIEYVCEICNVLNDSASLVPGRPVL